MVASHGPCGSLNVWLKLSANGVLPWAITLSVVTTRGSAAEYLFSARSVRAIRSLCLARTSTCASSDSDHAMKFHAASGLVVVADIPSTSPPTNVDCPPSGPGIGITPTLSPAPSIIASVVDGIGPTPTLPDWNRPTQVGPCSSLEP